MTTIGMGGQRYRDRRPGFLARLIGGLLLGLVAAVPAQAGVPKAPIVYEPVAARLKWDDRAAGALPDGDTWEGQSEGVFTPHRRGDKLEGGMVFTPGSKGKAEMSIGADYTLSASEVRTGPEGVECTNEFRRTFPGAIVAEIERTKKGLIAEWRHTPSDPGGSCHSYIPPEPVIDRVREEERIGDEVLILRTRGTITEPVGDGATLHTFSWRGRAILELPDEG